MLLGKRGRPPMRRTTSMSGITIDIPNSSEQSDQIITDNQQIMMFTDLDQQPLPFGNFYNNSLDGDNNSSSRSNNSFNHSQHVENHRFLAAMVSPTTINRRNSADFLTTCCLCKRRLAAGKDIYMYRGDTAFCSQECREKQMKQEDA